MVLVAGVMPSAKPLAKQELQIPVVVAAAADPIMEVILTKLVARAVTAL